MTRSLVMTRTGFLRHAGRRSVRCLAWSLFVLLAAGCATLDGDARHALVARALAEGRQALQAGDFESARARLRELPDRAAEARAPGLEIDALLLLAEASRQQGDPDAAVRDSQRALERATALGDARRSAASRVALGGAELARGNALPAAAQLEAGAAQARAADAPALEAAALNDLGSLRALKGEREEALRAYARSAELAKGAGDHAAAGRAFANAARASADRPEESLAFLQRAAAAARALPDSHDRASLLLNLGVQASALDAASTSPDAALRAHAHAWLVGALASADAVGDTRVASQALGFLAALYEREGQGEEALALTRRALRRAAPLNAPETEYRWNAQLGRLLSAEGRVEPAIEAYGRAIEALQSLRHSARWGSGLGASSFTVDVAPVYYALADLLLRGAGESEDPASRQCLLLRARDTVEQLKAAELRDYFRDDCVDALRARLRPLEGVSATALIVYPILLPERLVVLASLPSGELLQHTRAVTRGEVEAEARALRERLEQVTSRRYLDHARTLYRWLLAPLEAQLASSEIDTLVFVPDGALLTVPMAALHDGERFLVERFAVAITPGLDLTDPRPVDRKRLRALLGGVSEGVGGFEALPGVVEELEIVQRIVGGELLIDEHFRRDALRESLAQQSFDIVHLATHAKFSEDAEGSFLLTWDGRLSLDELAADIGLFRFRDEPLELLTLSACETARRDQRAALGLSGVAVKAGARSALGTLWSVNDPAAATLVGAFYENLLEPGVSRAVALQRAQQGLLADFRYRHPVYWAPFLLIGSWL
ncbi:MAG: CHAT domain-containing protein [Myxococcota bacterium]